MDLELVKNGRWYNQGVTKQKQKATTRKTLAHHAKHVFIPHKGNHYRPHLIRTQGLAVVLALALIIEVGYNLAATGHLSVLGRESNITISALVTDTNKEREANNIGDLVENSKLDQAAYDKAQDMLKYDYWAHDSPKGVTPWYWFTKVGYDYDSAGENLAKNYPDSQSTVDAWMASPTHRANILDSKYSDVGFAVVEGQLQGKETTLVVAEYGQPAGSAAAGTGLSLSAPVISSTNPLTYFASAFASLSPATFIVLGILMIVGGVAILAHHYRQKLPKEWKKSWRIHHGAYIAVAVLIVGLALIVATGGGQI